jgi:hypothetical protein
MLDITTLLELAQLVTDRQYVLVQFIDRLVMVTEAFKYISECVIDLIREFNQLFHVHLLARSG